MKDCLFEWKKFFPLVSLCENLCRVCQRENGTCWINFIYWKFGRSAKWFFHSYNLQVIFYPITDKDFSTNHYTNYYKWHVIKNCQKWLRYKFQESRHAKKHGIYFWKLLKAKHILDFIIFLFLQTVYLYCERLFSTNKWKKLWN